RTAATVTCDPFGTAWGSGGSGNGRFGHYTGPWDVAADASGNVYVADTGNHRIQKFDANGTFLTTWGGYGRLGTDGQFYTLVGIGTDGSGHVYVADTDNERIQKFDASGTFLTKWGSFGSGDGEFRVRTGGAADGSGNVYVADSDNDRIQKFGCPWPEPSVRLV